MHGSLGYFDTNAYMYVCVVLEGLKSKQRPLNVAGYIVGYFADFSSFIEER